MDPIERFGVRAFEDDVARHFARRVNEILMYMKVHVGLINKGSLQAGCGHQSSQKEDAGSWWRTAEGVQDYSSRGAVTRTNTCPDCSAASASRRLMGVTHTTGRCDCNHCCPLPSAGCPLTGGRAGLVAGCCFYYQLYGPAASVARKSSAGL